MPLRDQRRCRISEAAGKYYENDAIVLRRQLGVIEKKLGGETLPGILHGAVVPHGAYPFSLELAMRTLLPAGRSGIRQVVLLGPSHRLRVRGIAVPDFDVWRTPFGEMPEYSSGRELLLDMHEKLIVRDLAPHAGEHTLEVELPILHYLLGAVPVLPLIVGQMTTGELLAAGTLLAELDRPGTLWVVSSDFTHYGECFRYTPFGIPCDPEKLAALDLGAAELIAARDLHGFIAYLGRTGATVCGAFAVALYLAMLAAYDSSVEGKVVGRCDTGSVTGDYSKIVDYVGIRFIEKNV
ncbi:MAG: AmmeMemoRadiSam system protein B [Victivallaceae bacterium]|nr:AmmeMemoRadiSam system protein B [Victivallaceae bacterium]